LIWFHNGKVMKEIKDFKVNFKAYYRYVWMFFFFLPCLIYIQKILNRLK
jgi:hypothetical protein